MQLTIDCRSTGTLGCYYQNTSWLRRTMKLHEYRNARKVAGCSNLRGRLTRVGAVGSKVGKLVCGHTSNLEAARVGASQPRREAVDLGRQGAHQVVAVIANRSSSAYLEARRSIEQQRRRLASNDAQRPMQCLCDCRFCLQNVGTRAGSWL